MRNSLKAVFAAGAVSFVVGCASDNSTSPVAASAAAAALVSAPLSFDQLHSSFVGSADANTGGLAPAEADDDHEHQFGPGWQDFMGGGVDDHFVGGIGFGSAFAGGAEFGRGPFGDWDDSNSCAFSATTNRVDCQPVSRHGLTSNRSFSFLDASGAVQQQYTRGTTNTVNVTSSVAGTTTHHDGRDTSTVNASSDFSVAGLATGSAQRTLNGKSAGTESTKGAKRNGDKFTASRTAGDTISGVLIPIQDNHPTFPTAGTIVRSMQATITLNGGTPSTSSRREVITFDGSTTATVVITHDGVTKNCTKPLPHGPLTCQ